LCVVETVNMFFFINGICIWVGVYVKFDRLFGTIIIINN
jgi:hypothetical protein